MKFPRGKKNLTIHTEDVRQYLMNSWSNLPTEFDREIMSNYTQTIITLQLDCPLQILGPFVHVILAMSKCSGKLHMTGSHWLYQNTQNVSISEFICISYQLLSLHSPSSMLQSGVKHLWRVQLPHLPVAHTYINAHKDRLSPVPGWVILKVLQ